MVKKLMLGHGGAIAVGAHVDAHKLKSFGKYVGLLQAEGKVLRLADSELTFHIKECGGFRRCPTEDVVHDYIRVRVLVDGKAKFRG